MAGKQGGGGGTDYHLQQKRGWAVLVPYHFQGHLTPMLQLGSALHNKGFSILVAHTQYNSPNPKNHPHFVFHALHDGVLSSSGGGGSVPPQQFFATMQENCRAALEECLVGLLEKQQHKRGDINNNNSNNNSEEEIKCVIYDNNMFFAREVAARLNIPSIVMRPHCAAILQHIALALSHGSGDSKEEDESKLLMARPKDAKSRQYLENFYDVYPSVACIWNTADCIDHSVLAELQRDTKIPFFAIGPLHRLAPPDFSSSSCSLLEEDSGCLAWLDAQAPCSVVYVSCGSLPLDGGKEVAEIAWGLANCGQPFLWALLPGSQGKVDDLLPEGFIEKVGERGKVVKWAPQKAVLGHPAVAVYLTHAGWGSAMESICGGVPMICRPIYADQFVNSGHLSQEVKAGVELGEVERGSVERAIRRVLGEEGKEVRDRVAELKMRIEDAVGEGGSSRAALDQLVHFIHALPSSPPPA